MVVAIELLSKRVLQLETEIEQKDEKFSELEESLISVQKQVVTLKAQTVRYLLVSYLLF